MKSKFSWISISIEFHDTALQTSFLSVRFLHIAPIEPNDQRDGRTVAGGQEQGDAVDQLYSPFGVDADGSLFIADTDNHRIVRCRPNARQGEIVAGGERPGDRALIISERGSRRVIR